MPLRRTSPVPLSPGQALFVLERLVRDRVVATGEIRRYLADMSSEIAALEARLCKLRDAAGDGAQRERAKPRRAARSRTARTPRRAARGNGNLGKQLGGRFAGLIRRLPVNERSKYHDIKAKDGVEAAIGALQKRRNARS